MKTPKPFIVKGVSKTQLLAVSNAANDADYALAPVAKSLCAAGAPRRKIVSTLTQAAKRMLVCGAMDANVTIKRALLTKQARRVAEILVAEFAA